MNRGMEDVPRTECADACAVAAFVGGLAGGLIASLIMAGVLMLWGGR